MLLDLKMLFENEGYAQRIDDKLDVSVLPSDILSILDGDARVVGTVANRAGVVTLDAQLTVPIAAPCDRCLKQVKRILKVDVFHTLVQKLSGEDVMSDEYIEVGTEAFDLNELFLSEIVLNMPTKILCSPQCKGLCPKCGADLNQTDCRCDKKNIDPRFETLRDLLDIGKENE